MNWTNQYKKAVPSSYESEGNESWDRIEKLCQMLSGRDDIFYGTNAEVLL